MRGFLVAGTVGLLLTMSAPSASADLLEDLEETQINHFTGAVPWQWCWSGHPIRPDACVREVAVLEATSACTGFVTGCGYTFTVTGALGQGSCSGEAFLTGKSSGGLAVTGLGGVPCTTGGAAIQTSSFLDLCSGYASGSGEAGGLALWGSGGAYGVCIGIG